MTTSAAMTLLAAMGLLAVACRSAPPSDQTVRATPRDAAAELPGRWRLERDPPPPGPGIQLELELDSVVASRVYGRLASYFAGDVGGDPAAFPRFDGSVDSLNRVAFRIGHATTDGAGFVMRGTVGTDSIPLEVFVIGPDTASVPGLTWRLVRSR